MRTLTPLTCDTRWLSSRRVLFIVMLASLAMLISGPGLKLMRPVRAVATARFVAPGGSDGGANNCSNSGSPCLTINYAISQAVAGDTINVAAGLYAEDVDINKSLTLQSTSGAAVTTIQGAGHCLPTSCPGGPLSVLTLSAPGVTLDGFKITTTNPTINLITADGSANSKNQVIKNNVITNPTFDDANAGGGWGILLGFADADNNQILNNEISLNPDREKNLFTFGFWAQGGGSDNNVISGNNIHNIGTAIITDEVDNNTDILNNTFSNLARRGVVVFGSTNTEIINNSISNAGTAGIQVRFGATTTTIKSNFITLSGVAPITMQTPQGGVFVSDADDGTVVGVNVNFNRLIGNVPAGVNNISGAAVNAENNWWGCNFGPGVGGANCTGTPNGIINSGGGSIDADPWLTLGITAMPNSILVGGTSNLTADLTINSASADTSGSGNIPNGTPVAFAGVLGTVNPSNTSTTSGKANSTYTGTTPGSGSASTTVDGQTVSTPITVSPLPSPPIVTIADPAVCLGPGGIVGVTVTVTNNSGAPQTVSVTAMLPPQLQSLQNSCAANAGVFTNCTGGSTVAWSGTLAAGQTATLTYQAQVANGTPPGTQLCITTSATFGTAAPISVQACTTVNCPVVGPGTPPPAAAPVSDQKPGSVLFYNIYTSNPSDLEHQNTRINITNTDPSRSAVVHLFFVDGTSCTPADSFICLTPNQTQSFTAGDVDPGTTGYIVAVASDPVTGCPINFNFLIGDEFVKFSSGHAANLGAEAFAALANTRTPACAAGSATATLNFDGVSYNEAPRVVAVDNFPSTADGNNTLLILNRVGGDLRSGASNLGALFGVLFDEAEQPLSFTLSSNTCQLRGSLNNSFLRTTQRLETVVSAGRTGWLRLWGVNDIGLLGAVINLNANAGVNNFSQGHNLHKLTFTTSASLTIPIIPPAC